MTPDPLFLAIDTVLGGASVALGRGGEATAVKTGAKESEQAERLVPMISALMKEENIRPAELDGLLVDTGPGGFTGVRVGISAARALAFAWEKPLAGISSFEILGAAARHAMPNSGGPFVALRAGGRGEVNFQRFDSGGPFAGTPQPVGRESVEATSARFDIDPCNFLSEPGAAFVVWLESREIWQLPEAFAAAAALIAIAQDLPKSRWDEAAVPVYARPPDAQPRDAS